MSSHCSINKCHNGDDKLNHWKKIIFKEHGFILDCNPSFHYILHLLPISFGLPVNWHPAGKILKLFMTSPYLSSFQMLRILVNKSLKKGLRRYAQETEKMTPVNHGPKKRFAYFIFLVEPSKNNHYPTIHLDYG